LKECYFIKQPCPRPIPFQTLFTKKIFQLINLPHPAKTLVSFFFFFFCHLTFLAPQLTQQFTLFFLLMQKTRGSTMLAGGKDAHGEGGGGGKWG
jgi:hypothetical protein